MVPENRANPDPVALDHQSAARLKVLHFVPRLSWPLNTGAKLRNYFLAKNLARHAEVSLLAFSEGAEGPQSLKTFRPDTSSPPPPETFYKTFTLVARDRGYTPGKLFRGALGNVPLPVLNYTTASMREALRALLRDQHFDIVQVESIHLFSYLSIIRDAGSRPRIVLDWHNIESELMHRYSERTGNFAKRTYARRTAQQLASLERRALQEFDAHIVVSKRDREKLLALNYNVPVYVIENGVDTAYYSDSRPSTPQIKSDTHAGNEAGTQVSGRRLLFVGSMDYHANIDAAIDFVRNIWPGLHARKPQLVMTIVGKDPVSEVRALASMAGVEVTGTVDDVRPLYREAVAAVIPLKVGAGSRLKILEAMAAGTPVISTTLGAEGLEVRDKENIAIADSDEQLTQTILRIADDKAERDRLIAGGRALVEAHYDWSRIGDALYRVYERMTAKG
jgi:glycosyltransferase involved in cell wall biosynthesis